MIDLDKLLSLTLSDNKDMWKMYYNAIKSTGVNYKLVFEYFKEWLDVQNPVNTRKGWLQIALPFDCELSFHFEDIKNSITILFFDGVNVVYELERTNLYTHDTNNRFRLTNSLPSIEEFYDEVYEYMKELFNPNN